MINMLLNGIEERVIEASNYSEDGTEQYMLTVLRDVKNKTFGYMEYNIPVIIECSWTEYLGFIDQVTDLQVITPSKGEHTLHFEFGKYPELTIKFGEQEFIAPLIDRSFKGVDHLSLGYKAYDVEYEIYVLILPTGRQWLELEALLYLSSCLRKNHDLTFRKMKEILVNDFGTDVIGELSNEQLEEIREYGIDY